MVTTFSMEMNHEIVKEAEPISSKNKSNLRGRDWDWFITYLNLSAKTKKVVYNISPFDPAVRIYDTNSDALILTLQRLTYEGKNTDFPDKNVSVEGYHSENSLLLLVKDNARKILSLEVDGMKNELFSYDEEGNKDLEIECQDKISLVGGLIRLSPSYLYNGTDYSECFKKLRDQASK